MKKICFVCFNIEDMGGITRVMSNICREFESFGNYKLSIISICDTGKESHYYFSGNIKIFKLNNNPNDRIRNIIFKSFAPLRKIFKNNSFDIVFMEGHYIPPIVLPLKFFTKSKFVFCDHGSLVNQLQDRKATFFRKLSSKLCEKIVVLTERTKNDYKKVFGVSDNKISVIPNFIDEEIFKFKKEYDVNSKIILSSGRFTKEKGFDMLVNVASQVFAKHKDWQWHIYGDGPELSKIDSLVKEKKLENNVKFIGKVPWDEIPKYYQIANIFATASRSETQGLTVIEAMASSLPVIAADDESFKSIVVDDLNGYLFSNKKQYRKIVEKLLDDKGKVLYLSKQARISSESYSSKYFAERVLKVYESAIKESGNKNKSYFGRLKHVFKRGLHGK